MTSTLCIASAPEITGCVVADEREMARRIDHLLQDEARRKSMASAGWRRNRDEFTLERCLETVTAAL